MSIRCSELAVACLLSAVLGASAAAIPPYAGTSCVPGVTGRKTGFFHVEELGGKWWVVDPLGRGTVIRGCDGISFAGPPCEALGKNPYGEHNRKIYASPAEWEEKTLARLGEWGFNMLGNCRVKTMWHRGLAHAIPLNFGDALCKDFDDDTYWIGPDLHGPRTAFPNVFHPKFEAYCRDRARKICAPNRDDPWLFGYFLDNELAWNGWKSPDYRGRASASTHVHANRSPSEGLFDTVMDKRKEHTARQALARFMNDRYGSGWEAKPVTREMKLAFLEHVAETYFGTMERAIRAADPNHMILGARFDGLSIVAPKVLPEVWRAAGRHCDLLTFNCYPWADLDRNEVFISRHPGSARMTEVFRHFHDIAKRPFLLTEWSFPALDSGLPCRVGAGQRFRTQDERVRASELMARTVLALPFMVGYDYFKWVDQPALGCSRAFAEDTNYGLVDVNDEPYGKLVSMFARLHRDVAHCRAAGVPAARPFTPDPDCGRSVALSTFSRIAEAGARVTCVREGAGYVVDNGAGCRWCGRVGGTSLFDRIELNGREIGSMNGMLSFVAPGGSRRWIRTARVESAVWNESAHRMEVVGVGEDSGWKFKLAYRFTFCPGRSCVLGELVRIDNVGKRNLEEMVGYFRQHAPYEREERALSGGQPTRPAWKAPLRAGWFAEDGRFWAAATLSTAVRAFSYRATPKGTVHPDAAFELPDAPPLAPGASFAPRGYWLVAFAGLDGEASWSSAVDAFFAAGEW